MSSYPALTLSKTAYMDRLSSPLRTSFRTAAHQTSNDNNPSGSKRAKAKDLKKLSREARLRGGRKTEELARDYFEDGVLVPAHPNDVIGGEQITRNLIDAEEDVLFEATAIHPKNGTHCRIDVLRKNPDGKGWDMVEIKSATKVKPDYVDDLAFQRYVFEAAGYKIRDSYVLHLDTSYEAESEIDPQKLFKLVDVTSRVSNKQKGIEAKVTELLAHESGEEVVKAPEIQSFLDGIEYPIYYLDYETVMDSIPLYEGTRSYQQVPFQFSLHVQDAPGTEPRHVDFLHTERTDPREAFVKKLVAECGDKGSVVVFFQNFEEGRNKELAQAFPEYADELNAINARMVDIFEPFRQRWLYSPSQMGSASLKVLLPTYTDISYDEMEIGNGEEALQRYLAFVEGITTDKTELATLWEALEEYCGQDTYAMVELLDVLVEKSGYSWPQDLTAEPEVGQKTAPAPADPET